ncbi:hypothetical protein JVU11DRAFT_6520 [Chiua virens]|nr:hypothetical protein JVU11DRAFT_6520 [Chiua virens]
MSCPTCRKPVRRKDAFPLFLTPAHPSTQASTSHNGHPVAERYHERLLRELKETRAAHADCSERSLELQHEIDTLRRDNALFNQTIQHLQDRYQLLEERLVKEASKSTYVSEQSKRWKEETAKLSVEKHKAVEDYRQALEREKAQQERVKQYQGYIDRYKRKCNLERKKRKAIEDANRHLRTKDDDSLMVVDVDTPDILRQDPDRSWLDKACEVKGDRFTDPADEDLVSEKESEDEILLTGSDRSAKGKQREDQRQGSSLQFRSDWNLGLEGFPGLPSGVAQKQRRGSKRAGPGKSKLVKAKVSIGNHQLAGGPLVIDTQGHVKGAVVLGSRQKFNSKN